MRRSRSGRAVRMVVDGALAVLFALLMGSAIVEEVGHEWMGIALFCLFIVHQVLNRRWYARLFSGRYTLLRVVGTIVDFALVACIVGLAASSLILSEHAFAFLPALPGASWARTVHIACSYWGFVLMAVHAGLHVEPAARRIGRAVGPAVWVVRLVFVAVACFGAWSFVQLDMASYVLLQVQFVFADATRPWAFAALQYAAFGVLVAGLACYASRVAKVLGRTRHRTVEVPRGTPRTGRP